MPDPVAVVHVVAKTHLDLGFTALAAEVAQRYVDDFFPRAIAVATELGGLGSAGLVWTTGSWILQHALTTGTRAQRDAVAGAVADGLLAWHALPVTTHTELMDADLVRSGLAISVALDRRFGRVTTAAKMTDVPGHSRGLVPLLAEAGVTFLHLGVNPAWPVPDVPPTFRWRAPDGAEVVVAYQGGGYGGEVVVPGCAEALAFLHTGDNLGPPTAEEVVAAHRRLADRFPGAEVRGSTLDAFARALAASGAGADLPVVTAEIGDPWLFGAGSDPQKVAAYRRALAAPRSEQGDRRLLLVAEHTWGLDQKEALPDTERWDRTGLAALRSTPEGRRFEASWAEQRGYLPDGAIAQVIEEQSPPVVDGQVALGQGWTDLAPGQVVAAGPWELGLAADGALAHLVEATTGRVLADAAHPLGRVSYQSFAEADYERFFAGLAPEPADRWWARLDNTKPGIDAAGAVSASWTPRLLGAWQHSRPGESWSAVLTRCAFAGFAVERLGAPPELWAEWTWARRTGTDGSAALELRLWWTAKPANRLPEALWCSFTPVVSEPERWTIDKLGQSVSPLDVVRRGGRSLHGVGEGMAYDGPDGPLRIATPDAPLIAPGRPNLLDADPPLPDLAGGFHVLLLDNLWGTNFPMWSEGPAAFGFQIATGRALAPSGSVRSRPGTFLP